LLTPDHSEETEIALKEKLDADNIASHTDPLGEEQLRRQNPPFHNEQYHSWLLLKGKPKCTWCNWVNETLDKVSSDTKKHNPIVHGNGVDVSEFDGARRIAVLFEYLVKLKESGASDADLHDYIVMHGYVNKVNRYIQQVNFVVGHRDKRKATSEDSKKQ